MAEARRNNSKKRRAVYEELRARKDHPTAEMLYASLKPRYPDLSLGTVYRSLATFREDGTAVSVGTVFGNERYDACVAPHPHFICRSCGSVTDLLLPDLYDEGHLAEHMAGYRVESYALSFSGLCPGCSNKSSN